MKAILAAILVVVATSASAACPPQSPGTGAVEFDPADERLDDGWFASEVYGGTIEFDGGVETYNLDGSYIYTYDQTEEGWDAPEYRFYENGMRCIAYDTGLRFDLYVKNAGDLVMITSSGERFKGRIVR